jgi:hypothetical protein
MEGGHETVPELLRRWEKLRLPYNAVILVVVLVLGPVIGRGLPDAGRLLLLAFLAANVGFLAGPVLDGYLGWLGLRRASVTGVLFAAVTASAALGVAFVVYWIEAGQFVWR